MVAKEFFLRDFFLYLENILVSQISKDKKLFSETLVTHNQLLYAFVPGYIKHLLN